jgi:Thaumarchaeal output domain 1
MSIDTVIMPRGTSSPDTICEQTPGADLLRVAHQQAKAAQNPLLRQRPRVPFRRTVVATPLLADGAPDLANRFTGFTTDISVEGIGLEFRQTATMTSGRHVRGRNLSLQTLGLVLNLAGEHQKPACLGIEIADTPDFSQEVCHFGGQFTGFADNLLKSENLTPRLNSRYWQFEMAYPEAVLQQWVQLGVLETVLWDRVQLCPRCQGLPTFRGGCNACGSARLTNDRLIHHFACAHVDLIAAFENQNELFCPKCRTRRLIIGADYEYLTGPFRCQDCHWTGTEREQVAQCLRCKLRFPAHQSHELELKGYRANRLDPLALLPSLGPTPALSGGPASDRCPALCVH